MATRPPQDKCPRDDKDDDNVGEGQGLCRTSGPQMTTTMWGRDEAPTRQAEDNDDDNVREGQQDPHQTTTRMSPLQEKWPADDDNEDVGTDNDSQWRQGPHQITTWMRPLQDEWPADNNNNNNNNVGDGWRQRPGEWTRPLLDNNNNKASTGQMAHGQWQWWCGGWLMTTTWGMDDEAPTRQQQQHGGQMTRQDKQPMDDDNEAPTQVSLRAQCIRYIQYNLILFYYFCLIYGKPTISGGTVWCHRNIQLCGALQYLVPLGSVSLYNSVWLCTAKSWFADVVGYLQVCHVASFKQWWCEYSLMPYPH